MAVEFERGTRAKLEMPPPIPFPDKGLSEDQVIRRLQEKLAKNAITEKNFGTVYCGPPHPFAPIVLSMAL